MTRVEKAKQYAALVEKYAHDGEISAVGRPILQRQQMQLQLTEAEAQAIEQHVFQRLDQAAVATSPTLPESAASESGSLTPQLSVDSIRSDSASSPSVDRSASTPVAQAAETAEPQDALEKQDTPEKLQQYEQEFRQAIRLECPPGRLLRRGLQQFQQSLKLSNVAIEAIEAKVTHQFQTEQEQYQSSLEKYAEEVAQEADLGLPLSQAAQDHLAEMQRSLKLRQEDARAIEERVVAHLLMQPPPTELSDSPLTKLAAASSPDALTEMPPQETLSFISSADMPPDDSLTFQPNSVLQQINAEVSLRSEKGVDYIPLRDLLRAAKWQEADEETLKAMLLATNRTEQGWLDPDSLLRFPCLDLHTIDRLWSYYSNGKFGFTAQWRSYPIPKLSKATTSFQPSRIAQEHTLKFVKDMGWWADRVEFLKYYNRLTFSLNDSPNGHLPALWYWAIPWWKAIQTGGIGSTRGGCSVNDQSITIFMSRLKACGFE
jgi:GUN4-like